jgi:hypothetical protein
MMTFFLYETREFLLDFENDRNYTPKSLTDVRLPCREADPVAQTNRPANHLAPSQETRGRSKLSWTICRIPMRPFDYIVKAGNRLKTLQEEVRYRRMEKS